MVLLGTSIPTTPDFIFLYCSNCWPIWASYGGLTAYLVACGQDFSTDWLGKTPLYPIWPDATCICSTLVSKMAQRQIIKSAYISRLQFVLSWTASGLGMVNISQHASFSDSTQLVCIYFFRSMIKYVEFNQFFIYFTEP